MKTNSFNGALLIFTLILSSCAGESKKTGEEKKPDLQVEGFVVSSGSFDNVLATTANLMASEQVELKAPISGEVLEINFKEGQKVKQGQSIIRMDDRSWKAQLIGLKAQLANAENEYNRKKSLLDVEGSSQQEVDQAYTAVEILKSQIQQLNINIDLANVTAPFSGVIGMRNFSKGAYLQAGESITFITEVNQLKVDFTVAQKYQSCLEIGKNILVVIESDTLEAKIYAINPQISADSRTINVRAVLPQSKSALIMPGSYAEVLISTNFMGDAILIPTQAVIPELNKQTVYVYKNGKAEKRTVEIGNRTADKVHVLSGLSVGDTIVTTGLMQIKDGASITLQSLKK
jgi:membrane fusion protein (multidrug efflux system)